MNDGRAYFKHDSDRLHQGDIFRDVIVFQSAIENDSTVTVTERKLPYAVIITQECDLEQDFNGRGSTSANQDKNLPSILLIPAYPAEIFKLGQHLDGYQQKMESFSSERFKQLKQNQNSRYHFFHADASLNVPELVSDFKHYFTISRDVAYAETFASGYIATSAELFREHMAQRFCNYLSRIGLPNRV